MNYCDKLFTVFPGRSLDGEKTLQEELIKEKDELILIRRRLKEPSDNTEKDTPVPEVSIEHCFFNFSGTNPVGVYF